jgi:ADP-ribose pyrophosphatase YjhB (NUDIX family)
MLIGTREDSAVTQFHNIDALQSWLTQNGIDSSFWGTGNTKSITHLWHEIHEGEVNLQEDPPLRVVNVVQVIIRQGDRILLEAEQEFGDGQRRFRNQPPSEKIKPEETYIDAALRCLREELGLEEQQITLVTASHKVLQTFAQSFSYPGLPSQYTFHTVEAAVSGLPDTDFWRENRAPGRGDPVIRHRWAWRSIRRFASFNASV